MSNIAYRNFDLQILRMGDGYLAQAESIDAGNSSLNFTLPFSEDKLEALLAKLGPVRRVRSLGAPLDAAKILGGQLYRAIFTGAIGNSLVRGIEAAARENERLRIRLRLTGVPELSILPWECLYDEQNDRFLTLSYKTSIVRYLEVPQPVSQLSIKPPLNVLALASSPIGYDQLGMNKEWSNLQTALGKMPGGLVRVERLGKPTLSALQERLNSGAEYHILHYIGHGGFDSCAGKSVLVLEDDHRQARFVDGQQLGVLLHNHPSLRLAILNACEGAGTNPNDVFTGVAQNLIRQEIPAVIAMQFEITDSAAITLAKAFYEALARGAQVDAALAEARLAIFTADDGVEWSTPVLYLRSTDGRIFDVDISTLSKGITAEGRSIGTSKSTIPPSAPTGTISSDSPLYIRRAADEKVIEMVAYQEGQTIPILTAGQTGGSTLLQLAIETARSAGRPIIHLVFQSDYLDDYDAFLRQLCIEITEQLGKEDRVLDFWEKNQHRLSRDRCTNYLKQFLPSQNEPKILLAMDEVDLLIDSDFGPDFFGLLRNWHNSRAAAGSRFKQLDLAFVTSIEPHKWLSSRMESAFNVGDIVELADFTSEEVCKLSLAYCLNIDDTGLHGLMNLLGGHPGLIQSALHRIAKSQTTLERIVARAKDESDPFRSHLSSLYGLLLYNDELRNGLKEVLRSGDTGERVFHKLRKLGLVRREGNRIVPRCRLYQDYFREHLNV